MKIIAASIALPLLLLSSRAVSVANTSSHTAEEGIRRLNAEEVDAFLKNDRAAMARLWSDDFVVTNPLNKFVTKQQVLGMVDSGFLVITSFDRQIEYLRVYGDVVVVAGREAVVWGGRMPNDGKSENLRFTAVWMKQGGQWQQIARHANIVPPQPAVSPPLNWPVVQPSTISSGNSFAFADVLGKCVASTLPTSLIASVSAWLNFSS
jgi:ketosteroid isomerase-like protein